MYSMYRTDLTSILISMALWAGNKRRAKKFAKGKEDIRDMARPGRLLACNGGENSWCQSLLHITRHLLKVAVRGFSVRSLGGRRLTARQTYPPGRLGQEVVTSTWLLSKSELRTSSRRTRWSKSYLD